MYKLPMGAKVTIKLQGGLGNQMFQYAYIKALSLRHNSNFALDIHEYKMYFRPYELEIFDIEKKYAQRKDIPRYEQLSSHNKYIDFLCFKTKGILKRLNTDHHIEKQFTFDPDFLAISSGYIEGYFQSELYFQGYVDEIRKDFTFTLSPSLQNQNTIDLMMSCNSVSIHIRRGDYVTNNASNNFHGTCNLDYYHRAIDHIIASVETPVFFIFSDDINWAKENLKINTPIYFIDRNTADTNYEDMRLMSTCQHNIIANSSFSWRGAWLNNNSDKIVIAPEKRFTQEKIDIVSDARIKL